jgi:hypothetical protein
MQHFAEGELATSKLIESFSVNVSEFLQAAKLPKPEFCHCKPPHPAGHAAGILCLRSRIHVTCIPDPVDDGRVLDGLRVRAGHVCSLKTPSPPLEGSGRDGFHSCFIRPTYRAAFGTRASRHPRMFATFRAARSRRTLRRR